MVSQKGQDICSLHRSILFHILLSPSVKFTSFQFCITCLALHGRGVVSLLYCSCFCFQSAGDQTAMDLLPLNIS